MIGTIKVVSIKSFNEKDISENGEIINIMRPNILKNPFLMSKEEEREIVIRKFYHYLKDEFRKKDIIYNELMRLVDMIKDGKDLYLLCCCSPKACHGDIIKNAINGIIINEQKK